MEDKSDADLAALELFKDYPECLVQFAEAFCIIFTLIGIPGNLITIIALASCKKFRNATAIFIINLHICHLLFCCVVLPMSAGIFSAKHWIYSKTMCRIYPLLKFGLNGTALFTVVAITVNRYCIVCHPNFYPKLYKKKILIMSLISTWLAGFVLFIPAVFGLWGRFDLDEKGGNCTMLPDKNNINPKKMFVSVAFIGPYTFIIVCYSRIWWTVKKNAEKRQAHSDRSLQPNVSADELDTSECNKDADHRDPLTNEYTTDNSANKTNIPHPATSEVSTRTSIIHLFKKSFRVTIKRRLRLPTSKDKKLATMIFAIIVSFTVCHLPIMLTRVAYGAYKSKPLVNVLAHLLDYSSAFISPIIYVILSSEYRQAYTHLFKDCKKKVMKCFEAKIF